MLLGTMAGPVLNVARMMTSQVVVVDGSAYLVDCGYGALRQYTAAGLKLPQLRDIFITHQHSDHNFDYATLLVMAWTIGIETPIGTYGPPPLAAMTKAAFDLNRYDIDIRIAGAGRKPIEPLVKPVEITEGGLVFGDERVRVTSALVEHPPVSPAFAFRFDTPDRSIVFSGDTRPTEAVVALARGADTLVHEAMYLPAIDRMLAARPYVPPKLRAFLTEGHTTAEDAGRIAQQAGVRRLVLSHLLPGDDPTVTDEIWAAEARKHFTGEIVVGRDLLEV